MSERHIKSFVDAVWFQHPESGAYHIRCTGDNGHIWFINGLNDPDPLWKKYLADGGKVDGEPPPAPPEPPAREPDPPLPDAA
jgi:hypothetical protein